MVAELGTPGVPRIRVTSRDRNKPAATRAAPCRGLQEQGGAGNRGRGQEGRQQPEEGGRSRPRGAPGPRRLPEEPRAGLPSGGRR